MKSHQGTNYQELELMSRNLNAALLQQNFLNMEDTNLFRASCTRIVAYKFASLDTPYLADLGMA